MEKIINQLVEKAQILGFELEEKDVVYDTSRAYALYVNGWKIGEEVNKFGAYRNYLGGGIRGGIINSSIYIETDRPNYEQLKELAYAFEKALKDIENLDYYEDYAEHLEY